MNEQIEHELRRALRHVPAPDGFTDRVLGRLPDQHNGTLSPWWYLAAAAAVIVALLVGGVYHTREQRERQARRTERQVVFAFALAAEKLQHVNVNLERVRPGTKSAKETGEAL